MYRNSTSGGGKMEDNKQIKANPDVYVHNDIHFEFNEICSGIALLGILFIVGYKVIKRK